MEGGCENTAVSNMKVSGDWLTSHVRPNAFASHTRHGGGSWPMERAPGEVPVALIASAAAFAAAWFAEAGSRVDNPVRHLHRSLVKTAMCRANAAVSV
jgi:hypothetical protein